MIKLFIFIGLWANIYNAWAQADDKWAFKKLKKIQGIWLLQQNEEKTYAEWQLQTKNFLRLKEYKLQNGDTIITKKAYIYYSPFIRFNHPSSIHYNIETLGKDLVYTQRLEIVKDNNFHFKNISHEYIFQLNDKTLLITHISLEDSTTETTTYQRIK
jgi:hypothetical protein